jgi:hypothetical protein
MREMLHARNLSLRQLKQPPADDGGAGQLHHLSDRAVCREQNSQVMPSWWVDVIRGRGSRDVIKVNDTLTESCEGAVRFMVIAI